MSEGRFDNSHPRAQVKLTDEEIDKLRKAPPGPIIAVPAIESFSDEELRAELHRRKD